MSNSAINLTRGGVERQRSVVDAGEPSRLRPGFLWAGAIVLWFAMGADVFSAPAWQPPADITAAAEAFLQARTGSASNRTTIHAGQLDSRHRLPLCDSELEAFMRRGVEIAPRTVVGVRCTGSRPWKVYVPVDVVVKANVLTAKRTLPRGHLLTAADLTVDERDVSRMISGYFSEPQSLLGQRLKQPLLAGRVVTPAMIEADQIVRRGQTVTLVAASGGVNIRMSGKALTDGALNQRIRVENLNSGRVVEGIVRSPEHVEVLVSAKGGFFPAKPKVSPKSADTTLSNNDR
jgi:flagella basal body P-ring formation protein FlgA